jgi:hypothetical protein
LSTGYRQKSENTHNVFIMKILLFSLKVVLGVALGAVLAACGENTALHDYVNDHLIPAAFAHVEVADADGWVLLNKEEDIPDETAIVGIGGNTGGGSFSCRLANAAKDCRNTPW